MSSLVGSTDTFEAALGLGSGRRLGSAELLGGRGISCRVSAFWCGAQLCSPHVRSAVAHLRLERHRQLPFAARRKTVTR